MPISQACPADQVLRGPSKQAKMGRSNNSQYGITELFEETKGSDLINELMRAVHLLHLLHLTLPQSLEDAKAFNGAIA